MEWCPKRNGRIASLAKDEKFIRVWDLGGLNDQPLSEPEIEINENQSTRVNTMPEVPLSQLGKKKNNQKNLQLRNANVIRERQILSPRSNKRKREK